MPSRYPPPNVPPPDPPRMIARCEKIVVRVYRYEDTSDDLPTEIMVFNEVTTLSMQMAHRFDVGAERTVSGDLVELLGGPGEERAEVAFTALSMEAIRDVEDLRRIAAEERAVKPRKVRIDELRTGRRLRLG